MYKGNSEKKWGLKIAQKCQVKPKHNNKTKHHWLKYAKGNPLFPFSIKITRKLVLKQKLITLILEFFSSLGDHVLNSSWYYSIAERTLYSNTELSTI